MRHVRQVSKQIEEIEQEREALEDAVFLDLKTLQEMAEDRLRHNRHGGTQTGSTTAEAADPEGV